MTTERKRKKNTLHRENCQQRARKSHTNFFGDVISLLGRHGFEWSVVVQKNDNKDMIQTMTFPNRASALKHYNNMCKA